MMGRSRQTASAARAIIVVVLLAAAACATAARSAVPDGFAPSTAFLAGAADASAREPYRFAVSVEVTAGATTETGPEVAGTFDGERTHVIVDFAAVAFGRELPAELDRDDLVIETITDDRMLYARSPLVGPLIADEVRFGSLPPSITEIGEALSAGWLSVDVGTLEQIDPAWAACVLAGHRSDPQVYLDLIRRTDRVEDLGRDTVDGEAVHGLAGDVPLGDLLRLRQPAGARQDGLEALDEVALPIEVWVDGNGDIRRIELTEDTQKVTRALVAAELLPGSVQAANGVVIHQTMELRDHRDQSIAVDVPADARDMTNAYRAFLLDTGALLDPRRADRELAALEKMYGDLDRMYAELDRMEAEFDAIGPPPGPPPGLPPGPPPGPSEAEMEAQFEALEEAYQEMQAWEDIPPPPPPPPPPSMPPLPEIPPIPEPPDLPPLPEIPQYDPQYPG